MNNKQGMLKYRTWWRQLAMVLLAHRDHTENKFVLQLSFMPFDMVYYQI